MRFIDNDHKAANLKEVVASQLIITREQQKLLSLLKGFDDLFQRKLGTWNCPPVDLELKPGSTPHHRKHHVPATAHMDQVKKQ